MPTKPPYPLDNSGNVKIGTNSVTLADIKVAANVKKYNSELNTMREYAAVNGGNSALLLSYGTGPYTVTQAETIFIAYQASAVLYQSTNAGIQIPGAQEIKSVTDFLNLLTDPRIWLRIAEALIGIVLVGVALAGMSKTVNKAVKLTPAGRLL